MSASLRFAPAFLCVRARPGSAFRVWVAPLCDSPPCHGGRNPPHSLQQQTLPQPRCLSNGSLFFFFFLQIPHKERGTQSTTRTQGVPCLLVESRPGIVLRCLWLKTPEPQPAGLGDEVIAAASSLAAEAPSAPPPAPSPPASWIAPHPPTKRRA